MDTSKVVKIVRPERVARIVERVCEARLDVLIRDPGRTKTAVKAKAAGCLLDAATPSIQFSGLSADAVKFLWSAEVVQVDFVGMATQMIFKSRVISVGDRNVTLVFPKMLLSYDRRANARFATSDQLTAFNICGNWAPRINDITAPPVYFPYDDLGSWVSIADLSEGGFCGVARFPSILDAYERGSVDHAAKIIFPMQLPIAAPIEIRWTRRIRETLSAGEQIYNQRIFKFGAQFVEPSDELIRKLKQFCNQVSMSDAI